jgi:hypothetical protein
VFDIPSCAFSYFNFDTEFKDAIAPLLSRACIGFAQGANGSHHFLPSGVAQVFCQYITFEVIVRRDNVGLAFLYALCDFNCSLKYSVTSCAMLSTLSSSFPNIGKSHSILKSIAIHFSFLIGVTLAYFIADNESAIIDIPAIPYAISTP